MESESYEIISSASHFTYWFISRGKKEILKQVNLDPIGANTYNLSLADYDPLTSKYDYKTQSRNGDLGQVFATVVKIITDFTNQYPGYSVYIKGNMEYKTRAYLIVVNRFLHELENEFELTGIIRNPLDNQMVELQYNKGRKYDAIIIRKNRNTFNQE